MLRFLRGFFSPPISFGSLSLWVELEPGVAEGCSMHGVLSPHTT